MSKGLPNGNGIRDAQGDFVLESCPGKGQRGEPVRVRPAASCGCFNVRSDDGEGDRPAVHAGDR